MAQNLYISTLLTIVIDVSPNDGRDRIDILKSAKLALKSLVKDRKLPSCAEVRIVLCNRWDRQGVTIKNQNGAFRHPSDQSEILNDIQRIRAISIRRRKRQSALGLDGFSEVLQRISTGQHYPREVCVFVGNASNYSEEGSPNIEIASVAKLLANAKRTGATVYILDTGEKKSNKERLLSAVAQASGGLYESTTTNKTSEMRQKLEKIFEDISKVNIMASHITDILEVEDLKETTLKELRQKLERCLPTENSEQLVTHPSDDLKRLELHWLGLQDLACEQDLVEQLSKISLDSQGYQETALVERSVVAAVRRWNIHPSDSDEAMELADRVQEQPPIYVIRRPRLSSENEDPTRFFALYESDNGGILFQII